MKPNYRINSYSFYWLNFSYINNFWNLISNHFAIRNTTQRSATQMFMDLATQCVCSKTNRSQLVEKSWEKDWATYSKSYNFFQLSCVQFFKSNCVTIKNYALLHILIGGATSNCRLTQWASGIGSKWKRKRRIWWTTTSGIQHEKAGMEWRLSCCRSKVNRNHEM